MLQYLWMTLTGLFAFSTGRGIIRWTIASYIFGPLSLLVLVFLPKKEEKVQERISFIKEKTEQHLVQQEFKDINTVDDLFKQLETSKG